MAEQTTSVGECSPETLRDRFLRACDLSLFATAARYNLEERAERRRSATELATFFHRAVQALAPDLFIEAGAKDARSSRRAKRYVPEARVVAFEANPYTYQTFRARNTNDAGIEYLHLALSDKPGSVTFNVREHADGQPRADGHGSLMDRDDSYDQNFTQVTVEATTLDEFFNGYDFGTCALWIDVEGAARHVLSGGRGVLEGASILIIEVEDRQLWKEAWTKPEVERYLYDLGMVPVARDFESRYQYNMVFVRESLADDPQFRRRLVQHLHGGRAATNTQASRKDGSAQPQSPGRAHSLSGRLREVYRRWRLGRRGRGRV